MPGTIDEYEIHEYDDLGKTIKSEKTFKFNRTEYFKQHRVVESTPFVLWFFKEMFGTINTISGYSAYFVGQDPFDEIKIQWRCPTWKLVRIK